MLTTWNDDPNADQKGQQAMDETDNHFDIFARWAFRLILVSSKKSKAMNRKYKWPYLNQSLSDLPGEIWKDVFGFEDEYQVSNHGRIKSLRRWRGSGLTEGGYYTKDRIRRLSIRKSKNRFINKYTYCIGISLKKSGKTVSTSVARYVYYAFVGPFDMDDPNLVISYKDNNGRNLHYKNLILTNRSGVQSRSFRLKRCLPKFSQYSLPVLQLTIEGKLIARYASLKEAQDRTGITFTAIAACVDGRIYQSGGFRWTSPTKEKPARSRKLEDSDEIFNEHLWKALRKPRTSKKNPIPSLNRSLEDIKRERWKTIADSGGRYLISNLGRVKRIAGFKNGDLKVWAKEYVKRLIPDGNNTRPVSCLLVQLSIKDRKYQQSVARLVYHYFVKEIDMEDKTIKIRYRNGKCYDLNWKNLYI